ncbi:two-component system response regulator [Dechloromonas sp. ZS-1]|uniref:HD-GYP domain-containing protein n=1 Tax=Dechloromonas sp. ZS-1 TaxID=3138067 RepID=UPI0031FCBBE6
MEIKAGQHRRHTILVIDDMPDNIEVLRGILRPEYRVLAATSGQEALELLEGGLAPDLILLDVMMPGMDGTQVCRALKSNPRTVDIPVIFVTARGDEQHEGQGFELGAVDYIAKPVKPRIVLARVRTHLALSDQQHVLESMVRERTDQLYTTRLKVIRTLGQAAEFKDNETGMHIVRMSKYSRELATAMGMPGNWTDLLYNAAPMHDIGKIGIPDAVLLKPGKLDPDELVIMRTHAEIGARIIGDPEGSELFALAASVAMTHHEKWHGSGYPNGLSGEHIPLEGRIVAVADVFDALTSERPYKKAWTVDDALALLSQEKGRHFDPAIVDTFIEILPTILDIKSRHAD